MATSDPKSHNQNSTTSPNCQMNYLKLSEIPSCSKLARASKPPPPPPPPPPPILRQNRVK